MTAPRPFPIPRRSLRQPDEPVDREWADRVVARVRADLGALVQSTPPKARTATGLARHLALQVPLCHRLLAGVRHPGPPAEVLATLPGVEGFRILLNAFRATDAPPQLIEHADAAVNELEALMAHAGGSQRRLVAALSAAAEHALPPARRRALDEARRATFEGLVDQLGCAADLFFAARVYTPAARPRSPADLDVAALVGRLGFTRASRAMPVTFTQASYGPEHPVPADPRDWLLEPFCTPPPPAITIEQRAALSVGIVDPLFERADPFNIALGPLRAPNVVDDDRDTLRVNSIIACASPARAILQDVFLPNAWTHDLTCQAAAFMFGPLGAVRGDIRARWFERLPIPLTPGLLGRGLRNTASELHDRQTELIDALFQRLGLNADDFTGFRLAVPYPILFAQYLIAFERPAGGPHAPAPGPGAPSSP